MPVFYALCYPCSWVAVTLIMLGVVHGYIFVEGLEVYVIIVGAVCIKVLCNLNTKEHDSIEEIMSNLDTIKNSLMPFYDNNVIKPLSGQGKGKKNNNNRTKGKMGIASGSYNRR